MLCPSLGLLIVFHVATGAIHILLIVAAIVAIVHFVQGRRAPV
jgi:hypothetical protein